MNVLDKLKDIPEDQYITCQRIVEFCRENNINYVKPDPIKYRTYQFHVTNGGWNGFYDLENDSAMGVIVQSQTHSIRG
jgi:hypothetical protein